MSESRGLRDIIKRGGLITIANWPVLVVQFVAESVLKMLLGVPIVGGLVLMGLVIGQDTSGLLGALLAGEVREVVTAVLTALATHPAGLAGFLAALILVTVGGSALTFVVKAGTVSTLAEADRRAIALDRPPLRWAHVRQAFAFAPDAFLQGSRRLARRYIRLGLLLLAFYGVLGALYLSAMFAGYRILPESSTWWALLAFAMSAGLVTLITLGNFVYLVLQMIMAADDVGLRLAVRRMTDYLRRDGRRVVAVFLILLAVAMTATVASFIATAALGLISFVPLVNIAVVPLQVAAWLLRGLFFQYLGLAGLGAYLTLYRGNAS